MIQIIYKIPFLFYLLSVKGEIQHHWPKQLSVGLINSYCSPVLYNLVGNITVEQLKAKGVVPNDVQFK